MRQIAFAGCITAFSVCFGVEGIAAERSAAVEVFARADGSVELEGALYADAKKLGKKLAQIKARLPKPVFKILTQKGATFRELVPAYELLQQTGQVKLGFTTEPRER